MVPTPNEFVLLAPILMKRSSLFLFLFIVVILDLNATTLKVLFIGNSYTYTNNMPQIVRDLALQNGDTLIFDASDPGSYSFEKHCSYGPTITKIFSQKWDVVVLQEQSELPSFKPEEVTKQVLPYAHKLDSMVHANNPHTQTMFLMTWGHKNGEPTRCGTDPAICNYTGMQQRIKDTYMRLTQVNKAIVAPVGVAWNTVRTNNPSIELFVSDNIHPSLAGSYLEACVMYASFFHRHTTGNKYCGTLPAAVVSTLQQTADATVFDHLAQWQQYGHFPYTQGNLNNSKQSSTRKHR